MHHGTCLARGSIKLATKMLPAQQMMLHQNCLLTVFVCLCVLSNSCW